MPDLRAFFLVYRYAHLARHYVIDLLAVFQNQFCTGCLNTSITTDIGSTWLRLSEM